MGACGNRGYALAPFPGTTKNRILVVRVLHFFAIVARNSPPTTTTSVERCSTILSRSQPSLLIVVTCFVIDFCFLVLVLYIVILFCFLFKWVSSHPVMR